MPTFRRLLSFLRPYKRQNIWSIVLASLAMGMTILIPLARRPDDQRDRRRRRVGAAAAGAGDRRRRAAAARADRLAPDRRRQGLARGRVRPPRAHLHPPAVARARLLRLPADRPADVAGDGRPAVDPVLPRLRADLHLPERPDPGPRRGDHVRPPARTSPRWRCCRSRSSSSPPPATTGRRGRRCRRSSSGSPSSRSRPRSRSPASASSRRSRARSTCSTASATGSSRVFDQNVYSTRLRAFYNPMIAFLPNLGLAVVLLVGGRQVVNGSLSLGDFTAFYTYLIMLIGPMRMLGTALGMSQRAIASGNRLFEVLDREPEIQSPPGAPDLPAGNGHVVLRDVSLRYGEAGGRRSPTSISRSRAGRSSPSSARPGPARRASSPCSRASTTRPRARSRSTAPTSATSISARCGGRSPSSPTTASCSAPPSPRTSPTRSPTRPARRSRRRPAAPRRPRSSTGFPTATRRWSASAG